MSKFVKLSFIPLFALSLLFACENLPSTQPASSPSATASSTPESSPSATASSTPESSPSATASSTPASSPSATASSTPNASASVTASSTPESSPSVTASSIPVVPVAPTTFGELSCDQEGKLKSGEGKSINVTFANNTGKNVKIYWLDFTGKRVSYDANLADKGTFPIETFITHAWLIADSNDKCIKILAPDSTQTIDIK